MKKKVFCFLITVIFFAAAYSMPAGYVDDEALGQDAHGSVVLQPVERLVHFGKQDDWRATIHYLPDYFRAGLRFSVDFSHTNLTGFREEFFQKWDGVVVFDISNNQIRTLPQSIASVKTLKKLDVTSNPLEKTKAMIALRAQLVAQGVELVGWEK